MTANKAKRNVGYKKLILRHEFRQNFYLHKLFNNSL
ncbi:MAG: hypothetical protein RL060_1869, partial [Bacteroidota bacterium]